MGCTHVAGCPLFPKLNASLRGWRDAYCDSSSAWHDCARYQQSRSGRSVPLTLLPNGKYAQAIGRPDPDRARSRFRSTTTPSARAAVVGPFEAPVDPPAPPAARPPVAVDPPASRLRWWHTFLTWMRGPA